ncbi:helix-turn-helix domain-containing protein, partial [uncultured Desulfovibrio sp.]|uniref:helix-turn-helix domain-containing protein n=1 Tax=uncultured Desulfovibrio sp. TaxID=167968 RepID=UPI0032082CFC
MTVVLQTNISTTRNCHGAKTSYQNSQRNHGAASGEKSLRSIADLLGYSPAAISREVRRNAKKNG